MSEPSEKAKLMVEAVQAYGREWGAAAVRRHGFLLKWPDRALLDYIAELEAQPARLRALLQDAINRQLMPCDHQGIGLPGCRVCDPRIGAP